jgi:quinol monooxygenase YgiN
MAMPYRIARFHVPESNIPAAKAAIEEFARAIGEKEPRTLRYDAFREEDGGFLHVMEFADAAAEVAHRGTPHVRAFVDVLYPLCDVKPAFVELTPVARARDPRVSCDR